MFQGMNQKILLLAILLGLVTSTVVFFFVTKKPPEAKEMLEVVVAKNNIEPREVIDEQMLETKKMPAQFVHPLAFSSPQKLIGRMAKEKITAGEAILQNRVFAIGADSSRLSLLIPGGERAVTVAINEVSGVAGMLQPGDCVDVLGTFDENSAGKNVTSLFLQNIAILAVGKDTESQGQKKGPEKTTVTLLVTPWQAEQLALAEQKGVLKFALRPFRPERDVFTTNVVLSNLTRLPDKNSTPESTASDLPVYQPEPANPPEPPVQETKPRGRQIELIKGSEKELVEIQ